MNDTTEKKYIPKKGDEVLKTAGMGMGEMAIVKAVFPDVREANVEHPGGRMEKCAWDDIIPLAPLIEKLHRLFNVSNENGNIGKILAIKHLRPAIFPNELVTLASAKRFVEYLQTPEYFLQMPKLEKY